MFEEGRNDCFNNKVSNVWIAWNDVDECIKGSGELGRRDEQRLVDERFNSETAVWCENYRRRDVLGEIYRGRQVVLLGLVDELGLSNVQVF